MSKFSSRGSSYPATFGLPCKWSFQLSAIIPDRVDHWPLTISNIRVCTFSQKKNFWLWLRPCMPRCGSPFRAQGVRPNKYITYAWMWRNPAGSAARELCPGLQPATPQCSATCKILSQGHPINQNIVLACHLQHSTPVLVSANGYHPRPQHTQQISNIQACTCLTKIHNRSAAFVEHVGSTGAEWSATAESNQCFLVGPRLDVEVYGNGTSSFRSSDLYNLRWPAPKRTAEVTTESKNLMRDFKETFLSHKIHLFA